MPPNNNLVQKTETINEIKQQKKTVSNQFYGFRKGRNNKSRGTLNDMINFTSSAVASTKINSSK